MRITDADLRSFVDRELPAEQLDAIQGAVDADESLAERLKAIERSRSETASLLNALDGVSRDPNVDDAWQSLQAEVSPAPLWQRVRPAWAALAVGVVVAAMLLVWPPARATAQRLLGLLRIERVAVVTIDHELIKGRYSDSHLRAFMEAASDNVTYSEPRGEDLRPETRARAEEILGYALRLPANQPDEPKFVIRRGSGTTEFQLDVERFRKVLDAAGVLDVEIPQYFDGVSVRLDFPEMTEVKYGSCESYRAGETCIGFVQGRSPSIATSPQVDLGEVAEIAMRLSGFSDPESRRIRDSIDWTSTLVLPVPRDEFVHEEVEIDGTHGILGRTLSDSKDIEYFIVWAKNGMTYVIVGVGGTYPALQLIDSLE